MVVSAPNFSVDMKTNKLSHVNILIADGDFRVSMLLKKILSSLGFGAVYYAKNGHEALRMLNEKSIDIAITDWEMDPINGIEFIRRVRTSNDSPNRLLPIIMLTGKAQRNHVEAARDAGITEFVVKPFSVRTLCDRLILVVEHPRNFILSRNYVGPDRRRRSTPPTTGIDRRANIEDQSLLVEDKQNYKVFRLKDENVTIVNPDFRLKEKLGDDVSITDLFSQENIVRAQQHIHNSQGEYLQWIVDDIKRMEETFAVLENNADHTAKDVLNFYSISLLIKSQAGTFGYDLASQVAESMINLVEGMSHLDINCLRVIRKHMDVLYVIFQRNIQGFGGKIGKDLMENLTILTRKYSDK